MCRMPCQALQSFCFSATYVVVLWMAVSKTIMLVRVSKKCPQLRARPTEDVIATQFQHGLNSSIHDTWKEFLHSAGHRVLQGQGRKGTGAISGAAASWPGL